MNSPTVDLCSADSSQSEDAVEQTVKFAASGKNDLSKSPPTDSKAKGKKNSAQRGGGDEGGEGGGGQQQTGSHKKRSRATPSASDESESANGRKSVTDGSGKDGKESLWPNQEGEGPVQGSLLEEVLAEKRMALLRSPEVMQFLQQRQTALLLAQQQSMLEAQQHELCVGEVEEDAVS